MNTEHRYLFEKGSKKHRCPNCDKKRFVRYIDTQTGEYLPDQYGRCDRESKCGYFLNPYKDGYTKAIWEQEQGNKTDWKPQRPKRIKKPVNKHKRAFIPVEVFNHTRAGYEQNTFIQNLLTRVVFPFEVQDIEKVISLYHLGTVQNGYRSGANTFPFIDIKGNVRAVQVKQFDEQNHTTGTDFLHSIIEKHHIRNKKPLPEWLEAYNKNETKVSCLFGEHILSKYPYNPVALVEAPKGAIYGTLYFGFPEHLTNLIWLAVYNLSSLNLNKCKALKGRNVYLFPDLSKDGKAFELWSNKAAEIQKHLQGTYFHVSDLLEQLAPQQDKEQGKDIADYLIKQDWQLFRRQDIKETPNPKTANKRRINDEQTVEKRLNAPNPITQKPTQDDWDANEFKEISKIHESNTSDLRDIWGVGDILASLEGKTLPDTLILTSGEVITNVRHMVKTHSAIVKAQNGKTAYLPYLNRLKQIAQITIEKQLNNN